MCNIDEIMDMFDWNNSLEVQEKGRELAKCVKCINVFLQPGSASYGKNVWDNCAMVLAERTDEELAPYLLELMEWLQDMNWPGAFCIQDRLKVFSSNSLFHFMLKESIKRAKLFEDEVWLSNLVELEH